MHVVFQKSQDQFFKYEWKFNVEEINPFQHHPQHPSPSPPAYTGVTRGCQVPADVSYRYLFSPDRVYSTPTSPPSKKMGALGAFFLR